MARKPPEPQPADDAEPEEPDPEVEVEVIVVPPMEIVPGKVKARLLGVTGKVPMQLGLDEPYDIGHHIVVIGTATVSSVSFKDEKPGRTRVEVATLSDLFVVTDSTNALDLLQQVRAQREEALDVLLGRDRSLLDEDGNPSPEALDWDDALREELAKGLAGEDDSAFRDAIAGEGEQLEPDTEPGDDDDTIQVDDGEAE